jgi:hypothetical protein
MITKQMGAQTKLTKVGAPLLVAITILFSTILISPQQTRAQEAPAVGEGICVPAPGYPCPSGSVSSSSSSSGSGRPTSWGETAEGRLLRWMKDKRRESQHRKANELNDAGLSAYRQGRYADAVKLFQQALKHQPNNATMQGNVQNAMQEALREARAAAYHGANTSKSPSREDASVKARNIFDNRASAAPASAVDARRPTLLPSWPDWIVKDHRMVELGKERDRWSRKENKLGAKLAEIREKESQSQNNKPNLQVQESHLKSELLDTSDRKRDVENKMENYAVQLSQNMSSANQNR